ncbi:MAG: DUF192 domain-containing protein [Parasphingorhabdus sp.]|nr:DUF192 domain-containing protein [Parasphingorhabdus sp.]
MFRSLILSAFVALGACSPVADAPTRSDAANASNAALAQSPAGLALTPLTIDSASGQHKFIVEIAATPDQQEQGLMFRTTMADDAGMIFPYDTPAMLGFWMKNTVIPLDIIFIRSDGSIESIAANTTPYSLKPVCIGRAGYRCA